MDSPYCFSLDIYCSTYSRILTSHRFKTGTFSKLSLLFLVVSKAIRRLYKIRISSMDWICLHHNDLHWKDLVGPGQISKQQNWRTGRIVKKWTSANICILIVYYFFVLGMVYSNIRISNLSSQFAAGIPYTKGNLSIWISRLSQFSEL